MIRQRQQQQSTSRSVFLFLMLLLLLDDPPPQQSDLNQQRLRKSGSKHGGLRGSMSNTKDSKKNKVASERFRILNAIFSQYQSIKVSKDEGYTNYTLDLMSSEDSLFQNNITGFYMGSLSHISNDSDTEKSIKPQYENKYASSIDAVILPPNEYYQSATNSLLINVFPKHQADNEESEKIITNEDKTKANKGFVMEQIEESTSELKINDDHNDLSVELGLNAILPSQHPGLNNVSLVTGVLMFSDVCQLSENVCDENTKKSTSSNVLVGVRGIYFERTGKLSLIANTKLGRGVLRVGSNLLQLNKNLLDDSSFKVNDDVYKNGMKLSLPNNPQLFFQSQITKRQTYLKLSKFNCEFELNLHTSSTRLSLPQLNVNESFHNSSESSNLDLDGTISSSNCGIQLKSTFKATSKESRDILQSAESLSNDKDITNKALNYSFIMMLVCIMQIVFLLRQLIHTQSQSFMRKVSLLCIGWQTTLDAYICLIHVIASLLVQNVFTAMACIAFFKLLIFGVVEMKYMAMIMHSREEGNGAQTREALRRQESKLHVRFYLTIFFTFFFLTMLGSRQTPISHSFLTAGLLLLYSFWLPQIIFNIYTEAKKPLHSKYIYCMSISRLVVPLYFLALPNNFLTNLPGINWYISSTFAHVTQADRLFMCEALVVWVAIQTCVLIGQSHYGARFLIPKQFQPPLFDYYRPIPSSVLAAGRRKSSEHAGDDNSGDGIDLESPLPEEERIQSSTVQNRARNGSRHRRNTSNLLRSSGESSLGGDLCHPKCSRKENEEVYLDCVICCADITPDEVTNKEYMLAPCNHVFHQSCLTSWMNVKMECPVCRTELPPT